MRVRYALLALLSAIVFMYVFFLWLNAPTGPLHSGPDEQGQVVTAVVVDNGK